MANTIVNGVSKQMLEEIENCSRMSISVAPDSTFEVKVGGAFGGYYTAEEIRKLHQSVVPLNESELRHP